MNSSPLRGGDRMAAAPAVLKGGKTVGAERSERSGLNGTVWNRV